MGPVPFFMKILQSCIDDWIDEVLVRFLHGSGDIHHGQEHEDQGLDEGNEDFQKQNGYGNQKGCQQEQHGDDNMSTLDISEESNGE